MPCRGGEVADGGGVQAGHGQRTVVVPGDGPAPLCRSAQPARPPAATGPARRGGRWTRSAPAWARRRSAGRGRRRPGGRRCAPARSSGGWRPARCGPRAASDRRKPRIQTMPSGSRPLTGSSNISTGGSPSSAAAMPSRCRMPSEKPPDLAPGRRAQAGLLEHLVDPAAAGCRCDCASHSRWLRAVRPGCSAAASSSEPTWRSGWRSAGVRPAADRAPARRRPRPGRGSPASWWTCPRRSGRRSR